MAQSVLWRSSPRSPADAANASAVRAAWGILACVLVGTFMAPLDISIINIAMPAITVAFDTTITKAEWVALVYLLTTASLLMTHGRLADILGAKPLYIGGMLCFTAGSLLCGLAPALPLLVAARVVQALGAGALIATGPAIITRAFPATMRGRAMGVHGMTVAVGLACGPLLGGLLVQHFDWRGIFLVNVPIGIVGALWALRTLPREERRPAARLDVPGAIFLWVTLCAFLLLLSRGQEANWQGLPTACLLLAGSLGGLSFIWQERRSSHRMAALELFSNRTFAVANLSSTLSFMAMYGVTFLLPFYLLGAQHLSVFGVGLTMAAMPLVMLVVAPWSGALSDRIGSRLLTTAGLACAAAAIALLELLGAQATPLDVALRLALLGAGLGVFQSPNNSAIMGAVPRDRLGAAASMLGTMRHIGMVSGIAATGAVLAHALPADLYDALKSGAGVFSPAILDAYHSALAASLVFACLAALTAALRGARLDPALLPAIPAPLLDPTRTRLHLEKGDDR